MSITANNKCFFANFSELVDRYDPTMVLYNRNTKSFKYPCYPLKSLLKSPPQYGANEGGIERTDIKQPRYIRITDIDEYGLLNDSIGVTATIKEEKYFLHNNDILFARSGATVGKAYLHKTSTVNYDCFFAGYMIRFIVDEKKILPDYLFAFTQLNTYREWVKAIQRAAGQPNINAEEYKSLRIPLPDIETQKQVINKINAAYKVKLQKESEEKDLLATIENYILSELGIILPPKTIGLKNRIFKINYSEIDGDRFDAISNRSKELEEAVLNGKYQTLKLKKVVNKIKTGTTPHHSLSPYVDMGIPFLRNTNLKKGELDLTDIKFIRQDLQDQLIYSHLGDVIICIAGTVGDSALNTQTEPLAINQNITALKIDHKILNPEFLNYYFNTKLSIELVKRLCSIATIYYINNSKLLSLNIPIPPMKKQIEMLKYISDIQKKIRKLKSDATLILETVKCEVEEMILG